MSYQEDRDALIGIAAKEAKERVAEFCKNNSGKFLVSKKGDPYVIKEGFCKKAHSNIQRHYCHDLFTEFFHEAMERLVIKHQIKKRN